MGPVSTFCTVYHQVRLGCKSVEPFYSMEQKEGAAPVAQTNLKPSGKETCKK